MHWWTPLLNQIRHNERVTSDLSDIKERLHRLEIESRQVRERYDDLDGRHSSLSAQFRGRMGGRPPKATTPQAPLPVGVQHLFPNQER